MSFSGEDEEDDAFYGDMDTSEGSPEGDDDQEDEDEEEEDVVIAGPSSAVEKKQDDDDEMDGFHYEVLSPEQIVEDMVESIKEVIGVIQIPATTVRVLLNHFKWDKEKLMEKFFSDQQDKIFADAGIASAASGSKDVVATTALSQEDDIPQEQDCEICCLSFPTSSMTSLACRHLYCNLCWSEYLTTKIMDEGASQSVQCPGSDCDVIVDDVTVMRLVEDGKVRLRYQHLITSSFVQCNRLIRWCSAPDCGFAAKVVTVEPRPIKCKCGHVYCFSCSLNWHAPVHCRLLKMWVKKCDDDWETYKWISNNTKECPKCQAPIQKQGGCNHMSCKGPSCLAEFCWVCLKPWTGHVSCNRFEGGGGEQGGAAADAENAREALKRYFFHCDRYMNHMQSLKFEQSLYELVKEKMEEMQRHNMSWIEVQFLEKAVDTLCECRRTLMFTYVFAYYLKRNNQSLIFTDNQSDLESATEVLSRYLERDILAEDVAEIKQTVQDKYKYCDRRRKVLLDHVREGYDKEWWEYTVNKDE